MRSRLTITLSLGLALASLLPCRAFAGPREDARAAETAGDAERALAAWQRAVDLDPSDAEAALAVGRLQLRAGNSAQAIQTLAAVAATHPEAARVRYWLAFALRKAGRFPEAAEQYRRAIEASPDDADARFGQAETLKQMGDGAGALESYRAYVRLESRPSEARWVARANEEIDRLSASEVVTPTEGAPESAGAVAEAPPSASLASPPPAGTSTPEAAFAAGRFDEAKRALLTELTRSPDSVALRHQASVAALAGGDNAEAEYQAVTVVRLDPDNPTATAIALTARAKRPPPNRVTRTEAELALREGRDRTAAQLAGELLVLSPDAPDAPALARIRGIALHRLGRSAEALEAFRLGGGQSGSPGAWWLSLGDALAAGGDRPAARRAWRIAADLSEAETPVGRLARSRIQPPTLRVSEEKLP